MIHIRPQVLPLFVVCSVPDAFLTSFSSLPSTSHETAFLVRMLSKVPTLPTGFNRAFGIYACIFLRVPSCGELVSQKVFRKEKKTYIYISNTRCSSLHRSYRTRSIMTGKIDSFRFSFCQIRLENMCADGDLGYTDCFSRAGWSAPLAWQRSCRLLCHRSTVARPHGNDAPSLSRWRPAVAAEFGSARETETVLMGARFPCSRGF